MARRVNGKPIMDRLPLFLNLRDRRVGVIGDGALAARRVETLFRAGAEVMLFSNAPNDEFNALKGQYQLSDLAAENAFKGCALCYFAPEEGEEPDAALLAQARDAGALVNVADHPDISDFITPSVLDRSPLIVAISTGGDAPLLGRMLKARLETLIPTPMAAWPRLPARAAPRWPKS